MEEQIGIVMTNNDGQQFVITEYTGMNHNGQRTFTIRFLDSGYERHNTTLSNMRKGSVRDILSPSVHGVGILGFAKKRGHEKEYHIWADMLQRCYVKDSPAYEYYGEQGVTVCDRWKRFDYFLEDIKSIKGYDEELFRSRKLKLDKDIESNGHSKCYSLETCCFVTHKENMKEAFTRYNLMKSRKIVQFPDGHTEVITNLTDFCKAHDICYRDVYHRLNNDMSVNLHGYDFYYDKSVTTIPRRERRNRSRAG